MEKPISLYKLAPYVSEKIWGYEQWIVSTMPEKESKCGNEDTSSLINGKYPLLIKLIQANDTLSVQVHPDDAYAEIHENSYGKTECWYILDAKPGATLISGIKGKYDRESFSKAIASNTLEQYLYQTPVSKGDFIFIPAGTVHAIQGGLRILEIQQPSDVTYRLYDWGRGRELHVEKSLDVIKSIISEPIRNFSEAFSCDYFTVEKISINGSRTIEPETLKAGNNKTAWHILSGKGTFCIDNEKLDVSEGDTLLTESTKKLTVEGTLEVFKMHP